MDELVPMNPDRNPAQNIAGRVGRNPTLPRLSQTAPSTDIPSHRPNVRWSIQNISRPPGHRSRHSPKNGELQPGKGNRMPKPERVCQRKRQRGHGNRRRHIFRINEEQDRCGDHRQAESNRRLHE